MAGKIKCIGCGYLLDYVSGQKLVCPKCGTTQHVKLSADVIDILANANSLRRIGKFKKAKIEYLNAIEKAPDVAEAYFGMFLSEYRVNNEEDILFGNEDEVLKEVCATSCVEDNKNYKTALEMGNENSSDWEKIGSAIERFRKRNNIIDNAVLKNKYIMILLADEENEEDVKIADEIYDEYHEKIDIFYPKETLSEISAELFDVAITFALEEIPLLFVVSTKDTCSTSLERYIKRFCKTWDDLNIVFIGTVPENIEDELTTDNKPLEICDDLHKNIFKKVYLKANISTEESRKLMNSGVRLNDEDNPSPKLNLEGLQ